MTSAAQSAANRANAQRSTGPRTPEGKTKVSWNALKHGLLAREGVIRGEDAEEYLNHEGRLLQQLLPDSPLEEILADRIVGLSWQLKRAARDRDEAFAALYEKQVAGSGESAEPAGRGRSWGGCCWRTSARMRSWSGSRNSSGGSRVVSTELSRSCGG
ncbi:MAG: hypothetical protein MUC88_10095 [Planctomycetes bacterium]|jgi:hypothetical protein|nr:hypothetical protein [Planctomycetota bacterium]